MGEQVFISNIFYNYSTTNTNHFFACVKFYKFAKLFIRDEEASVFYT